MAAVGPPEVEFPDAVDVPSGTLEVELPPTGLISVDEVPGSLREMVLVSVTTLVEADVVVQP